MLGFRVNARLASHHSPLRERRELFASKPKPTLRRAQPSSEPHIADSAERDQVRETVEWLRTETRQHLDALIGEIVNIPLLKEHTVTKTAPVALENILQEENSRIRSLLERGVATMEAEGTTSLQSIEVVRRRVVGEIAKLDGFRGHIQGITVNDKEELNPPAWAEEVPDGRMPPFIRGYYDRSLNKVFVNSKLEGLEKETVIQHEQGHAIIMGVEQYLRPMIFRGYYEQQEVAQDIQKHAADLKDWPEYDGKDDDAMDAQLAERYVRDRIDGYANEDGPERSGTTKLEESIFAKLETREGFKPEAFERALLAEIAKAPAPGTESLLGDQRQMFLEELDGLGFDPNLEQHYKWCNRQTDLLFFKLLKRMEKWEGGGAERFPDMFPSDGENDLFDMLREAKAKYLRGAVVRELTSLRAFDQGSKVIDELLHELSLGENASEQYRLYGGDRHALWEEGLNRYADYRAGRDSESFTNLDELCLFAVIDPDFQPRPPMTREELQGRLGELSAAVATRPDAFEGEMAEGGPKGIRYRTGGGHGEHDEQGLEGGGVDGHSLARQIGDLKTSMHLATGHLTEIERIIRLHGDADSQHDELPVVAQNLKAITEGMAMLDDWQRVSALLADWSKGHVDSRTLLAYAKQFTTGGADFEEMTATVLAANSDEDRQAVASGILTNIKLQVTQWEENLEKIASYAEDVRKQAAGIDAPKEGQKLFEFYSIAHVMEAVTTVFESYKKAFGQWKQLKVSKLSKYLGDSIAGFPGSDRAKITLEQDLDHKNDETKDEFKKHLEHDLADFEHTAGHYRGDPHGFLEATRRDPNRFRGTLEYMGSKAWLYDLDVENRTVFGIPLQIGVNIPANWTEKRLDEYVRDLEQQQSKGESSEADRGKSRVNNLPDIPPMMNVLYDELRRKNYWATFGILERIVEKGKFAYSPVWASIVILDFIRDDPVAKKYFPKKLLDKYGNNGLPNGMIHKYFKIDRHKLEAFQQSTTLPFESAGVMAKISSAVERRIIQVGHFPPRGQQSPKQKRKVLELVSKVLAGQTVEVHGHAINIYDDIPPEFGEYRGTLETQDNDLEPGKIDDDYYNPVNDGSELVLGSKNYYYQLLQTVSQGSFAHGQKATFFLEQMLGTYDTIKKAVQNGTASPAVFRNYVEATRKKMDEVAPTWTQQTIQIHSIRGTKISPGKYLLLEMVRRRMISPNAFVKDLAARMTEQIGDINRPNFYDPPPTPGGAPAHH